MQLNCIIHVIQLKTPSFPNKLSLNYIQAKSDNKDLGEKMGEKIAIFFQLGFSAKIKEPQLGSSRTRKFQLGLITTK